MIGGTGSVLIDHDEMRIANGIQRVDSLLNPLFAGGQIEQKNGQQRSDEYGGENRHDWVLGDSAGKERQDRILCTPAA